MRFAILLVNLQGNRIVICILRLRSFRNMCQHFATNALGLIAAVNTNQRNVYLTGLGIKITQVSDLEFKPFEHTL